MSPTGDHSLPRDAAGAATGNADASDADASDEQLVQRYAAGELAAFDLLYSRYELPVWRYALHIVRVPSMADTLLKDIWFSVLRQIASPDAALRGPLRAAAVAVAPSNAAGADASSDSNSDPNSDPSDPGNADRGIHAPADWRFKPWLFGLAHSRVVETMRSARKPIDPQSEYDMPEQAAGERNAGRLSIKAPDASTRAGREVAGFRQLRSLKEAQTLMAAIEHLPFAQRYAFLMHAEGRLRADEIAHATAVSFETAINRLRFAREALRLSLSNSL